MGKEVKRQKVGMQLRRELTVKYRESEMIQKKQRLYNQEGLCAPKELKH